MKVNRNSILTTFFIFLRGLFMGSADIIPGVSGGTVAFITGIYEHFIFALKSINISFVYYFFKGFVDKKSFGIAKKKFYSIDFQFLIPLALGVLIAFLSLANIIGYALEMIPTYTYAFFLGLILASSIFVYITYKETFTPWFFIFFVIFGFIFSYVIVGFESVQNEQASYVLIFLSGVISFCAMILPGLSGAFILYMLGQYEFLLDVLRELTHFQFGNVLFALCYIAGGLTGLLIFSRVVSYLFKNYKMATLSFILGLMIGALRKPAEFIIENPADNSYTIISIIFGTCIVIGFSYYEFIVKKKYLGKESS